jgi:3-oxo-5-alpha-steroid 4-dehydrogenase 3 / polyprenol reductase
MYGWLRQYQCHKYLASLQKYTLPEEGMFKYLICPHYTCECLIYLGMALQAAPAGQLLSRSILCGLFFVVVNLGVTARGTKQWYQQKFGPEKVAPKWRMIPFVF